MGIPTTPGNKRIELCTSRWLLSLRPYICSIIYFILFCNADIDPRPCICSAGISLSSQTPKPGVTLACVLQRIFLPLRESSLSPFSHTALVKPRLLLSTFIRVLEAGQYAGVQVCKRKEKCFRILRDRSWFSFSSPFLNDF